MNNSLDIRFIVLYEVIIFLVYNCYMRIFVSLFSVTTFLGQVTSWEI